MSVQIFKFMKERRTLFLTFSKCIIIPNLNTNCNYLKLIHVVERICSNTVQYNTRAFYISVEKFQV